MLFARSHDGAPYAQVLGGYGGWRALNHPTVCTVGAVVPMYWVFTLFIACEPGSIDKGVFCRCRDNKLEEGDFQEA
jgi:hypothetical protein